MAAKRNAPGWNLEKKFTHLSEVKREMTLSGEMTQVGVTAKEMTQKVTGQRNDPARDRTKKWPRQEKPEKEMTRKHA